MSPLEELQSGQLVVPPHLQDKLTSPLTHLMSDRVRGAATFIPRLMQTIQQNPVGLGLSRSDYTDIPGDEPANPSVGMATDLAMNMVGAPMFTTNPATLGSGARLPRQAFNPDGGVNTGWVMRDVSPFPNAPATNRIRNRLTDTEDFTEVELPIRSLLATQDKVNPDFAKAAARSASRGDNKDLPAVFKLDGKYYVGDGHHRLVASADKSSTAKVRLFDLDRVRYGPDDPSQLSFTLGSGSTDKRTAALMQLMMSGQEASQ